MKARLIRDLHRRNPAYKAVLDKEFAARGKDYPIPKYLPAPAGTEIDGPHAWKLVMNGDAEPVCQACLSKVVREFQARGKDYAEDFEEIVRQRERLHKGIHPDHFKAYDEGRMDGYDADGKTTLKGEPVELPEDKKEDGQTIVIVLDDDGEPGAEAE